MGRPLNRWLVASSVVGAVVLAALASVTRAFTGGADLVVAAGIAGVLTLALLPRPTSSDVPAARRPWGLRWAWWVVPIATVVAWELFNYASAPRFSHPTLSSMLDALDASHIGLGATFLAWLALGWYLVRR